MVATLAALVLGLLTASAKNSYDTKDAAIKRQAANIILLDSTLALYGPETQALRSLARQIVLARLGEIAPAEETGKIDLQALSRGPAVELIQSELLNLSARTEREKWTQTKALEIATDIAQIRWQTLGAVDTSIAWPLLAILIFWLGFIFTSFGIAALPNRSTIIALLVCALSVGGAVYLIIQLDQPYDGLIKLSTAPLRNALEQMGHP